MIEPARALLEREQRPTAQQASGAWAYVQSEQRWHRVWAIGHTRWSVERCNLDDAHLSACTPIAGKGPRCHWCYPPEPAPSRQPSRQALHPATVAIAMAAIIGGLTFAARPVRQVIAMPSPSAQQSPAVASPTPERPPTPGPSPSASVDPSASPSEAPEPTPMPTSPTPSPTATPEPTAEPSPTPSPTPSPSPGPTPEPTCFHPGDHTGNPHPCDWPQLP